MQDPLLDWDGVFPYDALAAVGVTPQSTMQQIRDVSFDLMARGMSVEERAAWDQLRLVEKRLVVDFFLYQTDEFIRNAGESEEVL